MGEREVEHQDALKVNEAEQAIGAQDLGRARALLDDVASRTPPLYQWRFEENGKVFYRFWDQAEFLHFATIRPPPEGTKEVVWLLGAYPRAHYYLAFLDVHMGRPDSAERHLQAALALEPDHPMCLCELGLIRRGLGQLETSLEAYEAALTLRPIIDARKRAMAMRGKAVTLIEMGRLDEAEVSLVESLKFEPGHHVAVNELDYIKDLRAGAPKASAQLTRPEQPQVACEACDQDVSAVNHRVLSVEGRVVHVCKTCEGKATKSWWQFWK